MKRKVPKTLGLVMLCCVWLLSVQQSFSQQVKTISGHVKDEQGLPMPSVSVSLVGTSKAPPPMSMDLTKSTRRKMPPWCSPFWVMRKKQ
ncbi:hypothetical protein ACTJKG_06555 [Mucilaginibacter sp. 22184]